MKTVGIIGGSGFIGSYVTKNFLEQGFKVKVSSTDITKGEKYAHLKELTNAQNLSIIPLNVENKKQLENFVSDCDIVVHGGTPFQLDFVDAKTELFDPTIKGTENFLAVINSTPSVKKAVLIASVAAYNTNFPLPAGNKSSSDIFSEKDTPFMSEESHPYAQAKFIANTTVNDFIKNHPNLDVEITTVSPVGVFGKSMSQRQDSTSTGLQYLIKNNIAPNPFVQMLFDTDAEMAMVNVKDVAKGIYNAATKKGLHGKNYLLSSESYPISDISLMLNKKEPQHAAKVIYQNGLAERELDLPFVSAQQTLNEYAG
ncbi:NAD-dependent epimerase/dehydratase family protein [Polaribacter glomeratus]|uniref:Dihydroflavonol 4-reductase n=1 Tax=Polaribacter glomeratus TaxID=102 RepID=A0A2S7WW18_9FLAO|nr:NAD-dependent epimerase/dehydratase family protein [Polaribacter glomeratus]PQJ81472.1 dihydroflavonol 4-reductase [Polaribacter glomeratus]TXD64724.1 NAD-dependent epimerase/dehydratase family protein [Polaribacter glomeratus]